MGQKACLGIFVVTKFIQHGTDLINGQVLDVLDHGLHALQGVPDRHDAGKVLVRRCVLWRS